MLDLTVAVQALKPRPTAFKQNHRKNFEIHTSFSWHRHELRRQHELFRDGWSEMVISKPIWQGQPTALSLQNTSLKGAYVMHVLSLH